LHGVGCRNLRGVAAAPLENSPYSVDWVVVGGGGAGCTAAAALADAGFEVTVLERGPSDLEPEVASTQSANGWPKSVNDAGENIRWTEGVWGVVAKVLGGGTSLNGGLYFADQEEWFRRALPDLDMSVMNASYLYLLQQLANPSQPTDFGLAWNTALTEGGFGAANLSDTRMVWDSSAPFVPYSTFNLSAPGKPRFGSSSLLHSRSHMKNLHVLTNAEVKRINFEGKRATHVEVKMGNDTRKVNAGKGVIVSAGAIYTPQLLQISGVGPRALLNQLGVEKVVSDLPAVGANFTDRLVSSIGYPSPSDLPLTVGFTVEVDVEKHSVIEGVGGGKIATELGLTSLAFAPPQYRLPALRPILAGIYAELEKVAPDEYAAINRMIQPVALQTDTHSRGSVQADSLDSSDPPRVTANYFADNRDLDNQMARYRQLSALSNTHPMLNFTRAKQAVSPFFVKLLEEKAPTLASALSCLGRSSSNDMYTKISVPCSPTPWNSDEALAQFLKDYVISSYHYFGTAAAGSAVDGYDFAVKGTEALHVVDASVIPFPTTVNPQGTVMALGHYLGTVLAHREKSR